MKRDTGDREFEVDVTMMSEPLGQVKRIGRGLIWAILALALLPWLAACSGQGAISAQPEVTAVAQAASTATPMQGSPTAAAPTQVPMQPSSTQLPAAQSVPTQTVTIQTIAPAPACSSPAASTPAVTEGPYFKAGSPERSSLLTSGITGTKLVLTGYVLTADCKPIAHALLDFWHADANGNYDNSGYTLRGHQFTDASGRYQLTTIVPGLYPGRTEHIHVKVQAANGPVLTTQLFFPGVAGNQTDSIFDPKLLVNVQDTGNGLEATFNFIVNAK